MNQIWIDADACPKTVKDILFKMSKRLNIQIILVANQPLRVPESSNIDTILVSSGLDEADNLITEKCESHDLVITDDIPLAARVIEKGAFVITPRGKLLSDKNIGEQLSLRNFMDELRSGGLVTGGPAPLSVKDKGAFANQLDRFITQKKKDGYF